MASFNVSFKPSLQKDFRRLSPQFLPRILERIEQLQAEPFPHQAIKLSGADRLYRIRVGDYRIIYEVDTAAQQVTIHYVRHRREVYRNL
jgi:mRNA interferase RelE/StbE